MQVQLDGIQITWTNLTGKPAGFADDLDNDKLMEISANCAVDQIVKWDGIQWNCADSANNQGGGDLARKLDCFLIRDSFSKKTVQNFQDGCELRYRFFDATDLSNTNLSYADLTGASFDEANLEGVDFTGANLSDVELYQVNIDGAIFTNAYADPPCRANPICDTLPLSPP
jgi:uncharacterized protein YjbI with pentapeptide repeats